MIVADTNLIASLWVPNNMEELAYSVLKRDHDWVSPLLWKSEFRNVLALYLRKDIMEFSVALQAMEEAEEFMKEKEYEINFLSVLSFVAKSSCSSYDCEFATLADELNVQLVTFDNKLISEFPTIAIHPEKFISDS